MALSGLPLPASAYRPDDSVIGEDDGERLFGRVSERFEPRHADEGIVLVRWSDMEYDATSLGHEVPAKLLRLWPAVAHTIRGMEQTAASFPQGAAFHAHLDGCARCRNEPFNLCAEGSRLLAAVATAPTTEDESLTLPEMMKRSEGEDP